MGVWRVLGRPSCLLLGGPQFSKVNRQEWNHGLQSKLKRVYVREMREQAFCFSFQRDSHCVCTVNIKRKGKIKSVLVCYWWQVNFEVGDLGVMLQAGGLGSAGALSLGQEGAKRFALKPAEEI